MQCITSARRVVRLQFRYYPRKGASIILRWKTVQFNRIADTQT